MAIPIRYIYNSKGYAEVWLFPADAPGCRLFALEPPADCSLIKSWAACSETVEEFLDSMALEGLLTLTQLETLVQTLSPLRRIWKQLRILCQQVGDIGVYPGHIVVEEGEYFQENEQINLTQHQIREAEQVWIDYEEGNRAALHSLTFGSVLQEIGFLAGRRLGLVFTSATHFSDWLASRITGWERREMLELCLPDTYLVGRLSGSDSGHRGDAEKGPGKEPLPKIAQRKRPAKCNRQQDLTLVAGAQRLAMIFNSTPSIPSSLSPLASRENSLPVSTSLFSWTQRSFGEKNGAQKDEENFPGREV